MGRFETISTGGSTKFKYVYDEVSNETDRYSYLNGVTIEQIYGRDSLDRMCSRVLKKNGATLLHRVVHLRPHEPAEGSRSGRRGGQLCLLLDRRTLVRPITGVDPNCLTRKDKTQTWTPTTRLIQMPAISRLRRRKRNRRRLQMTLRHRIRRRTLRPLPTRVRQATRRPPKTQARDKKRWTIISATASRDQRVQRRTYQPVAA